MADNQASTSNNPLLPYEFAKTQRIIAFTIDQKYQVLSEKPLTKDLFQELYRLLANHFEIGRAHV